MAGYSSANAAARIISNPNLHQAEAMYRYIPIATGLIVAIADAIAFEVWVGWKQTVCIAQPLVSDRLHPNFFQVGRSSFCYVSDNVAAGARQFAVDLLAAGAIAAVLLAIGGLWAKRSAK